MCKKQNKSFIARRLYMSKIESIKIYNKESGELIKTISNSMDVKPISGGEPKSTPRRKPNTLLYAKTLAFVGQLTSIYKEHEIKSVVICKSHKKKRINKKIQDKFGYKTIIYTNDNLVIRFFTKFPMIMK
jgi:hypothetical protein